MSKVRILIVEDEQVISDGLNYLLVAEGYNCIVFNTYESARTGISNESFDLALLDISLPGGSGYQLSKLVKAKGEIPVVFLTAMDNEVNVVMGLDQGADDYVTKPFRVRELVSRIQSVLRRYKKIESGSPLLKLGDVIVDTVQAKVSKAGKNIELTSLEYRLLLVFAGEPNRVFSRNQLLERLWDCTGDYFNDNTLTVYIKRLREKIEDDPKEPKLIETVRGMGYRGVRDYAQKS